MSRVRRACRYQRPRPELHAAHSGDIHPVDHRGEVPPNVCRYQLPSICIDHIVPRALSCVSREDRRVAETVDGDFVDPASKAHGIAGVHAEAIRVGAREPDLVLVVDCEKQSAAENATDLENRIEDSERHRRLPIQGCERRLVEDRQARETDGGMRALG